MSMLNVVYLGLDIFIQIPHNNYFVMSEHLILVVIAYLFLGQNTTEPTCFQAGECTQSLFIGDWHVDDAQACLVECQNDDDCLYFTFFENDGLCDGFANCEVFQEHSCVNCYSGESTCEGKLVICKRSQPN